MSDLRTEHMDVLIKARPYYTTPGRLWQLFSSTKLPGGGELLLKSNNSIFVDKPHGRVNKHSTKRTQMIKSTKLSHIKGQSLSRISHPHSNFVTDRQNSLVTGSSSQKTTHPKTPYYGSLIEPQPPCKSSFVTVLNLTPIQWYPYCDKLHHRLSKRTPYRTSNNYSYSECYFSF